MLRELPGLRATGGPHMRSLAVTMIVRNESEFLPACLASIRPVTDEIIVADTGSSDNTIHIARQGGARVIQIPWHDDFAEARNLALAQARSDWVLSLDADEQLDHTAVASIPDILANTSALGCQVTIRNYLMNAHERVWDIPPIANDGLLASTSRYPVYVPHENVRLFRRRPGIYFVGRVHESVGPRIRASRGAIAQAPFVIHHLGFVVSQVTKDKKNRMYREMGRRKIEELPGDWQAHFELGLLELEHFKNLSEAHRLLARACSLNPNMGVAWFFYGLACFRLNLFDDALQTLRKAENCGHKTAPVAQTRGDACYNLGRFDEARAAYEVALKREPGNAAVQAKLGLAIVRSGSPQKGIARLQACLASSPDTPELYEGLILSYVFLDKIREAAETAERKVHMISHLYAGDYLRAASLWAQLNDLPRALALLQEGLCAHPGNPDLLNAFKEVCQGPASGGLENSHSAETIGR